MSKSELRGEVAIAHDEMDQALDFYLACCHTYRDAIRAYVEASGSTRGAARQLGLSEGTVRRLLRKEPYQMLHEQTVSH